MRDIFRRTGHELIDITTRASKVKINKNIYFKTKINAINVSISVF